MARTRFELDERPEATRVVVKKGTPIPPETRFVSGIPTDRDHGVGGGLTRVLLFFSDAAFGDGTGHHGW